MLFHTSFGTLEFFSLYRVYCLWQQVPPGSEVARLYRRGFGCYGIGLVCWGSDLLFCETMRSALPANPQLHAWWHVFVSGGLYILLILVAHNRCTMLGQRPSIAWLGGVLPYVSLPPLEVVGTRMTLQPTEAVGTRMSLHPPPFSGSGASAKGRSPSPRGRRASKSKAG